MPSLPARILRRIAKRLRGEQTTASDSHHRAQALAAEIKSAGGNQAVVYLDIGSAGAPDPRWQRFIDSGDVLAVMVDMVDDWSRQGRTHNRNITHVRAALGGENRQATAYITRHPACSSCLRPNFTVLKDYPVQEWFEVVREVPVAIVRYEDLSRAKSLPQPQIVKIDVQGYERQVLEGLGSVLDAVLCLEFETQLKAIYEGQDTFIELYDYLNSKGFVLRDMKPQGPFEGEAMEFNSFWSRKTEDATERSIVELWEMANAVWIAPNFAKIDAHQRDAYRFNT